MDLLLAEVPTPPPAAKPKATNVQHFPNKHGGGMLKCIQCGSNTAYTCTTCAVALHPVCFALYHQPEEDEQEEEMEEEDEDEDEDEDVEEEETEDDEDEDEADK